MSKIAIIDMGTNTFHLLLAEVGVPERYRIIGRAHEVVKLGKGGINQGIITDAAFERAVSALKKFKRIIDGHDVKAVHAFGTSAIRNARNGKTLIAEIQQHTGISVTPLSGDEEADLIFKGIQAGLDLGEEASLIMDIGAGSVEFIIGTQAQVHWKRSFEIGGQRLLDRFVKHDPITGDEVRALDDYFREVLTPLTEALHEFKPRVLVGSSGSFDTLSEIFSIRRGIPYRHEDAETSLSMDGFYSIYAELVSKSREERMNIRGMIGMRVDMIVVACCLIRYVIESHDLHKIRVSTYSLKEGALSRIVGEGGPH